LRYLLDTHVLVWWLTDHEKLSKKVCDLIADHNNQIFISSVTLWEMALKKDLGKLSINVDLLPLLQTHKFQFLALNAVEALGVIELPTIHSDPFDRVLIMQAKLNNLVLITKDAKILEYPIVTMQA
jgi:PIN domain nuclease of toxin-antitoxin system